MRSRARTRPYPWPCGHCGICDFRNFCRARLEADDHLVLVAGMRRGWAERLLADGVDTLAQLGSLPANGDGRPHGLRPESFEKVRHQAELQLRGRVTGTHLYELLDDEEERGFRLLPAPDHGDVWLDLEGHPFYEPARGLEFLFGYCYRDDAGEVRYEALWARDRDGERAHLRAVRRLARRAPPPVPRAARLPLRRLRAHRADPPDGRARDARARGRRPPPRRGARRPLPHRPPVAPRLDLELLDQGDRGALRVRAHRRGEGRRRRGRLVRDLARDGRRVAAHRGRALQRGGLPLDLRAARVAPLDPAGRRAVAGAAREARRRRRRRSPGTWRARHSASACSRAPRRATRGGSSATSSSTTSARRGRNGGRGSAGRSSTRTS